MMNHWTFIGLAYGFTAACILAELVILVRRRRQALDRATIERDFDESE